MNNMIESSAVVVTIIVTGETVAYWMVTVVTRAFTGKANREGRPFIRSAVFVLADHRDLLHGM